MAKKRHHFIPKAYLKAFCNEDGKVHVYRKDDPDHVIVQSPDGVGFHKFFYSQPTPDGGVDHERLEDLFSEYEARWPSIVQRLRRRESVNNSLDFVFGFIALQRARVPASRDACEAMLASLVHSQLRQMKASGKLSPAPVGLEDIFDTVQVAVDPHQSIHAMVDIIRGTGKILNRIGIVAIRNTTDKPFITCDNPVIWYDPSVPERTMRPYAIHPEGPIALLFPVAPDLLIYGDSTLQDRFSRVGMEFSEPAGLDAIDTMNRNICRFAYRAVFAQTDGFRDLVREHCDESPVVRTEAVPTEDGELIVYRYVWGKRSHKPKWKGGTS